ncbi:ferredoxin [Kitasatospora sp. NPDC091207]|uniref:ferredoxin n=1 Tax=Kitasatospora sp. NPDC091207 TaxID=3364083 RepID=UPI0038116C29
MQVSIDQDRCCSSGQCVVTAPDVFEQDDRDGLVRIRLAVLPHVRHADVRLASELCPGGAITVAEETPDRDGDDAGSATA